MDECVFSPNTYRGTYYAPKGNPHRLTRRFSNKKYVAVMGFLGARGAIMFKYKEGKAFIGMDFCDAVAELKRMYPHTKISLFVDNASIHVCKHSLMYCEQLGVHVIRNVPYRADLNGVEFYWQFCKRDYRKRIDRLMTSTDWWDNVSTVEDVCTIVPEWQATLSYLRGLVSIRYA